MEAGEERLQRSADALHQVYSDTDPELWEALNGGPQYPGINMSVSFDITWQKRGFTYISGLGVCIDVLTGLVINHHVLFKFCHACEVNTKRIPHVELLVWKAAHAHDCCINHNQCSKAMECEAGKVMWGCSITKYSVWYVEVLSDCDSFCAQGFFCELKPYGKDVEIRELESVYHDFSGWGQPS